MMETWHPLGVVGVITAFNFPVAVWSWNAALALVCGNPVVWKPSEKTPLTALCRAGAASSARRRSSAARRTGLRGGAASAAARSATRWSTTEGVPLVSATGSTAMGRQVGARRRGALRAQPSSSSAATTPPSSAPTADLDLALRGIAFAAVGTAGQRCTTLRRLIVHDSVYDELVPRLARPPTRQRAHRRPAPRPARWSGR